MCNIFNNDIDKMYLVFITKEKDLFFQIMLAYKGKNFILPPKYSSLQSLCLSTIIEYKLNFNFLPTSYQNYEKYREYINTFFKYMERFNERGWQLRYEPCKLFCNYSVLPKDIDSDVGLIGFFPKFHFQTIWQ